MTTLHPPCRCSHPARLALHAPQRPAAAGPKPARDCTAAGKHKSESDERGTLLRTPIPRPKKPKVFYGWWIAGAGMGIQIIVGALMFQAFGAYVAVLRDEFGWSKTLFSFAFSMSRVESGILGPLQGWMIDRFGPRAVMQGGLVIFAAGFMSFSQLNSPLTFFLSFFLMSVGASLGGFMALTVAIVNWFERRRAMALGIMSSGLAVGGLLLPLVILSFDQWGWRNTSFASGIIVLLIGLPLTLLVRHKPEQYGLRVDGDPTPPARAAGAPSGPPDFTVREALRTKAFWYISIGHAAALLVVGAIMVHLIVHINESLGFSLATAGLVVALMTVMMIVGQIGGGWIGDRADKRHILVGCMIGHAVALLFLAFANSFWMVAVFAVLHGLSWGTRGPLQQALRADYFGRASFGKIMGFSSMVMMTGMTLGPIIAGVLADRTGSYTAGFTVLAIMAAIGSIFFLLATPPQHPSLRVQQPADEPEPQARDLTTRTATSEH